MIRDNVITAKCECGNEVDVYTRDRLKTIAKPSSDKKYAALMGMKDCKKCGKLVRVYSYIEIHEA